MSAIPTVACRQCGRQIAWVRTTAGKPMPIDPETNERGNVLVLFNNGVLVASVLTKSEMDDLESRPPGMPFLPHFATCPEWPGNKRKGTTSSAPAPQQTPKPAPAEPPPSLF